MGLFALIMTVRQLAVSALAAVKTLAGLTAGRGWQPPVEPDNPEAVGIVKLAEAKENA